MKNFRYLVVFAIWLNMVAFFQTRVNMSVTVLAFSETNNDASSSSYQWTGWAKNRLLGSFFYGYVAGQFSGGLLSFYLGPKHATTLCLLLSSALVIACPLVQPYGLMPLCIVRALLGLLSGPLFSSKNLLVGSWCPIKERTIINSIIHGGSLVGVIFANMVGGYMCNSSIYFEGWKEFLYVSGIFNALTLIIWVIFVTDSPQNHPWVSSEEKEYLQNSTLLKSDSKSKSFERIPYIKLFTSSQVWIQTCALFAHLSIFFTFLVALPMYLKNVCNTSENKAAYYSIIPFCGNFIVLTGFPFLVDYLRTKRGYNITKLRRFSSGLAFVGCCVCLFPLGYVPTDTPLYPLVLVTIAMCFLGCNYSGFTTAVIEMAPRYSGMIVGINNTFASTSGFLVQLMNGKLKLNYGNAIGWRYTFLIIATSSILLSLPYVIFGSSELQSWAKPKEPTNNIQLEEKL